ncbi:hypothetical protein P7C73_g5416, partial [Tremellales sp. Uapishka_1]
MKKVFATLFPFQSPAWNSLLATFYISSVPNFILLAVPATLEPSSLNTMISFATGGLLGDVFLHLVPHAFFGEGAEGVHGRLIVVEEKRNIVIGGAIFLGFACFFVLDKSMRVLSSSAGGSGHSHSHSHAHSHESTATTTALPPTTELTSRKSKPESEAEPAPPPTKAKEVNASLKLSAYLNLFGDFTHNITDGLAMAASFYSSPALGAVTTIATFAHEIPHEAMGSQFFTAVGAFVGTLLGIWIAETSGTGKVVDVAPGTGIFGRNVRGGELVIPMTAGGGCRCGAMRLTREGFLYIASVSVIPELLAESKSAKQALKEYAAMAFGVFCMAVIAWNE